QAAPQPEPPRPAPPPPPAAPPVTPRTAEQAPIPVRVVEPAKSAEQLAREMQETQDRETFNSRLLMYSGLLVVLGGLLSIAFLMQTLYMLIALRAMRKAANRSERNMTM